MEDAGRVHGLRQGQPRQGAHRQFRRIWWLPRQSHPFRRLGAVPHRRREGHQRAFGEGQAIVNLLGSRIEGVVQLPATLVSHVKGGNVRVLAVLGSKPDPIFPEVPTAKELGFPVALDMWRGIAVPEGTPKEVIAKLQGAIKESVVSPAFADAGFRWRRVDKPAVPGALNGT
jgi:hypothetical protein